MSPRGINLSYSDRADIIRVLESAMDDADFAEMEKARLGAELVEAYRQLEVQTARADHYEEEFRRITTENHRPTVELPSSYLIEAAE